MFACAIVLLLLHGKYTNVVVKMLVTRGMNEMCKQYLLYKSTYHTVREGGNLIYMTEELFLPY